MVSPRCKSSSSNCRHSKENLNLDDGSTPITGTITDSPNLMSSQRDQRSHALNENNVRVLPNEMDSIWKSVRQIFHKLKNESQIRPHSSGGCEKKQKIKENTRCSTWSHLDCLKERGNILPPTKIVVDEIQNAYDQRMQEAQVYSNTEMKKGSRVDPSENIPLRIMDKEKKSVKPFQKFVKFQTPLCYLEICRRLQDGNKNCRCTYCVPGKNRYYCGCYDVICKEIAEETNDIDNGDEDVTCRKINFFKNFYNQGEITGPNILEHHMCNDKRCSVCEDVICKCAFESRPKIRRTPPE